MITITTTAIVTEDPRGSLAGRIRRGSSSRSSSLIYSPSSSSDNIENPYSNKNLDNAIDSKKKQNGEISNEMADGKDGLISSLDNIKSSNTHVQEGNENNRGPRDSHKGTIGSLEIPGGVYGQGGTYSTPKLYFS